MEKIEAILIDFDELKKIKYFGKCGVKVDIAEKCLFIKIDGLQQLTSSFDQTFIKVENFLCVIDELHNHNYVLVFPDKAECNKVFVEINKKKYENEQNHRTDFVTENDLFKNNFYIPILKEIQASVENADELRNITLRLVNSFKADQRKSYMDLIFEKSLKNSRTLNENDSFNDSKTIGNNGENNISGFNEGNLNSPNMDLNETNFSCYNFRKRRSNHGCIKKEIIVNDESFGNNSLSRKRQRLSSINNSFNNPYIDVPYHKFIGFTYNDDITFRLIIFTSEKRKSCYEFYYHRGNDNYYCKKCKLENVTMSVKVGVDDNGRVKFKFGQNQHICQPFEFSDTYIINETLIKMEDESENVNSSLMNKRKSDVSNNTWTGNILDNSNFEFFEFIKNGTLTKRLIQFTSPKKTHCFEYYYHRSNDNYYCKNCFRQRSVSIKVFTDSSGKMEFKSNNNHHICQPIEYVPDNYKSIVKEEAIEENNKPVEQISIHSRGKLTDNLLKTSNYEIVEKTELFGKHLFLFTSVEKKFCYEFHYNRFKNNYYCIRCARQKQTTTLRVITENDGIIEYKTFQNRHICEPIEYLSAVNKTTNSVLADENHNNLNDSIISSQEPNSSISSLKTDLNSSVADNTFSTSNFKIVEFLRNGSRTKRLLMFTSAEKKHCYEFCHNLLRNSFYCKSCSQLKHQMSVKIISQNDENTEFKSFGKQHICQPIEYLPENYKNELPLKVVYKPNFSITDGKRTLTVTNPSKPDESFVYSYSASRKIFYCGGCISLHKHVQAKHRRNENGEEYIELSNAEHICKK
uniref:Uncharacterized protein n=2 Tax=Panagrolaimus sp. PS1159 TaxID=55785 RepID=A0AC35FJ06_9BILA